MSGIESWSTTPANNNQSPPFGWPAGILPSQVEPIGRQMMTSLAAWYQAAEWINYNFTPTYVGATQFTLPGNVTPTFHVGRRVQATDGSTSVYGTITVSAFTTLTTVTVVWDSGVLQTGVTIVYVSITSKANPSAPTPSFINTAGNWTIAAPSSGATVTVSMLDGSAGAVIFDSGAPTTGYRLQFQQNGATKGYIGLGTNTFVGAAVGDFGIAANNTVLRFSSNGGANTHAQITGGTLQATDKGGTLQNVGWLECPQNAQAGNYTTVLADSGKSLVYTGAGVATFTIDSNANVPAKLGTVHTFINRGGANLSIAINTDTLLLAGTATSGTRTLTSSNGMATAIKTDATVWVISGSGLT